MDLDLKYSKPCPNQCDIMGYLSGGSSGCKGCSFDFDLNGMNATAMFDENGNLYKGKVNNITYMNYGENVNASGVLNSDFSYNPPMHTSILLGISIVSNAVTARSIPLLGSSI